MRKPTTRNRTFQSHGSGKGSADRTSNDAAYRRNFDAIKWSNKQWVTPGVNVLLSDYVGDWDFIRSKPSEDNEDNEMRESARGYLGKE